MARKKARKYTCRACLEEGKARPYKADTPQKIRVHRVKVHGEAWERNPRGRGAKAKTNSIPTKRNGAARSSSSASFKRDILKLYSTQSLLRELGDRASQGGAQ
jgi:hypothetical protein